MGYYKHISSEHKLTDLKIKEVWQYRDLVLLFTKRNFQVRYKQTILGPAWLFINPIISSLIYYFIFGGIAGISTGGVPPILFYMTGNALWTFFANSVNKNAATFTSNASIFGKVYFPRLTIPVSNVLTAIVEFLIQMILVACMILFFVIKGVVHPDITFVFCVPVALLELGVLGMGTGILISSVTTKYRDLAILVGFAVQLWMYLTPVVYPLSEVKNGWMRMIVLFNPVTTPVEMVRASLLGSGETVTEMMIYSWVVTLLVFLGGVIIFNKVERNFMDTV